MNQSKHIRLRRTFRPRAVLLAFAFALAGLTGAAALLASGQNALALFSVSATASLLMLTGIVLLQRNTAAIIQSIKKRDERVANLERIVSRAEWRNGKEIERLLSRAEWRSEQSNRKIQSELRDLDPSVRLGKIEASLHSVTTALTAHNSNTPTDHGDLKVRYPAISERDLELFLAHLLSDGNSKGN